MSITKPAQFRGFFVIGWKSNVNPLIWLKQTFSLYILDFWRYDSSIKWVFLVHLK